MESIRTMEAAKAIEAIRPFEPLLGKWYVESYIGGGSFGKVYKVYRRELEHTHYAAIKHIPIPKNDEEAYAVGRDIGSGESIATYFESLTKDFYNEILIMDRLKGNTNIVSYEDSCIIQRNDRIGYDIFIRMELLDSLTSISKKQLLKTDDILKIGMDICKALDICHSNNIIHRDIKPDNIFINSNGDYKLGDFGIARKLKHGADFMSIKGAPNYIAPEVMKGEHYDQTCDIYSLGLVLYKLLNRDALPFFPLEATKRTADLVERANNNRLKGMPMPNPRDADDQLSAIILKACAFSPADRYQSAKELYLALRNYMRNSEFAFSDQGTVSIGVPNLPSGPSRKRLGPEPVDTIDFCALPKVPPSRKLPEPEPVVITYPSDPNGTVRVDINNPTPNPPPVQDDLYDGGTVQTPNKPLPPTPSNVEDHPPYNPPDDQKSKKRKLIVLGLIGALSISAITFFGIKLAQNGMRVKTGTNSAISNSQPTAVPTVAPTAVPTAPPTVAPNEVVSFSDPAFDSAYREKYKTDDPQGTILGSDIIDKSFIKLVGKNISSIHDCTKFANLTELYLYNNNIGNNLYELCFLNKLTKLDLGGNEAITELSGLVNMKSLTSLYLYNAGVADISALSGNSSIIELGLNNCPIADVSVLTELPSLTTLHLSGRKKTADLSPISKLTNLSCLILNDSNLTSIDFLKDLSKLTELSIADNSITDISLLEGFKKLTKLDLSNNNINDLSVLKDLKMLKELTVSGLFIENIAVCTDLKQLTVLDLSNNNITDISALEGLKDLTELDLSNNNINDLSVLKDLKKLKTLTLSGNPIINSEAQLAQLRAALPQCDIVFD